MTREEALISAIKRFAQDSIDECCIICAALAEPMDDQGLAELSANSVARMGVIHTRFYAALANAPGTERTDRLIRSDDVAIIKVGATVTIKGKP